MRKGYKDLIVWERSMELTYAVYEVTKMFPHNERYGLVSQMQRAAVSIPSNIAEGSSRSKKDFSRFLTIAFGSGMELETQLLIAKKLKYISDKDYAACEQLLSETLKILSKLRTSYTSSD